MPYDDKLAQRISSLATDWEGLSTKKMFGGIGFMINGNMCCGVYKSFLILRLGENSATQLLNTQGVRPFDITGRVMSGWVMVEPSLHEDNSTLRKHLELAHSFVQSLPPK